MLNKQTNKVSHATCQLNGCLSSTQPQDKCMIALAIYDLTLHSASCSVEVRERVGITWSEEGTEERAKRAKKRQSEISQQRYLFA